MMRGDPRESRIPCRSRWRAPVAAVCPSIGETPVTRGADPGL